MSKDLDSWLKAGRHLPAEMRDFHDQKALFAAMHALQDAGAPAPKSSVDQLYEVSPVVGHVYVVDPTQKLLYHYAAGSIHAFARKLNGVHAFWQVVGANGNRCIGSGVVYYLLCYHAAGHVDYADSEALSSVAQLYEKLALAWIRINRYFRAGS